MSETCIRDLALDYQAKYIGRSVILHADCFEWLGRIPENSLHAIVTDPPYGVKEYDFDQIEKRANGNGGIWRLPPAFDGSMRAPLPRFTALSKKELDVLTEFFVEWSKVVTRAMRPGAHMFIASNSFLSQMVFSALTTGNLEFRGQLIRLVRTMRGGDRPKNAEVEFPNVSSLPRGNYEPWGIFRKLLPKKMKVSECLREYQTGGIRRLPDGRPFNDVIFSGRTPRAEKEIADHPSLKPQSFLRQVVYVSLPLGEGIIADPFTGSGSTVAAAEAMGLCCVGSERYADYYKMAASAVPKLKALKVPTFPEREDEAEQIPMFD